MAPHSSTLAWKIPWMVEPGGLQSMGSQRVGHDWVTSLSLFTFLHWGRKWQPTPAFLPGESQGWGSLVGCRLWGLRVRHNWSDLAVAAGLYKLWFSDQLETLNYKNWEFPSGSVGKESASNAGDLGWITGLERSPGGGHGNPLEYSCLENPHG